MQIMKAQTWSGWTNIHLGHKVLKDDVIVAKHSELMVLKLKLAGNFSGEKMLHD